MTALTTDPVLDAIAEATLTHRPILGGDPHIATCACGEQRRTAHDLRVHIAQAVRDAAAEGIRTQVIEQTAAIASHIAETHQASAVAHRAIALQKGGSQTPKGKQHMTTALAFKHQAGGAWDVMHAIREIGDAG